MWGHLLWDVEVFLEDRFYCSFYSCVLQHTNLKPNLLMLSEEMILKVIHLHNDYVSSQHKLAFHAHNTVNPVLKGHSNERTPF